MFVDLSIQHEKRMSLSILLPVASLLLPHFPHYLTHGTDFEKKLLNIKCVFLFSIQFLSQAFSF